MKTVDRIVRSLTVRGPMTTAEVCAALRLKRTAIQGGLARLVEAGEVACEEIDGRCGQTKHRYTRIVQPYVVRKVKFLDAPLPRVASVFELGAALTAEDVWPAMVCRQEALP